MSKVGVTGWLVTGIVALGATSGWAGNVSTAKIQVKDNSSISKRLVQVQSKDPAITLSDAGNPATNGASLHLYNASSDFCVVLPGGASWKTSSSKIAFNDKATKRSALIGKGKLSVTVKSGVTYSLAGAPSGPVNAVVRFGTGTSFCMRCTTFKKNTVSKLLAKNCVAATCDEEPSSCTSLGSTTTTTPGSTTTTTLGGGGTILKGALTATSGRFNYNLQIGLPAANAACNTNFAGTHVCSYAELQSAATAGDLTGLKDTGNNTVTGFWAIDSNAAPLTQCQDDAVGGSGLNWEYGTAHTASRGQKVPLTNATGVLGSLQTGLQCNFSGASWVGCCQ